MAVNVIPRQNLITQSKNIFNELISVMVLVYISTVMCLSIPSKCFSMIEKKLLIVIVIHEFCTLYE